MNGERDIKYKVGKGLRSEAARTSGLRIFAQETQSYSHVCELLCVNIYIYIYAYR